MIRYPFIALIAFIIAGTTGTASAQWEFLGAPPGGSIPVLFPSSDGQVLFASSPTGLERSTDGGSHWQPSLNILWNSVGVSFHGKTYLIGPPEDSSMGTEYLYTTTDNGFSWSRRLLSGEYSGGALSVDSTGVLRIADLRSVLTSTDEGATWSSVPVAQYMMLSVSPWGDIYGTTANGLFRSTDGGSTFDDIGLDSLIIDGIVYMQTDSIVAYGMSKNRLHDYIFLSADRGTTWRWRTTDVARSFLARGIGNRLYAGDHLNGLSVSTNYGLTWHDAFPGNFRWLHRNVLGCLALPDGRILTGTAQGIFRSTDTGTTWKVVMTGKLPWRTGDGLDYRGSYLIASHSLFLVSPTNDVGPGIWRTTNGGRDWEQAETPDTLDDYGQLYEAPDGSFLALSGYLPDTSRLLRSVDSGAHWQRYIPKPKGTTLVFPLATSKEGVIYSNAYKSLDSGRTWVPIEKPLTGADYQLVSDPAGGMYCLDVYGSGNVEIGRTDWYEWYGIWSAPGFPYGKAHTGLVVTKAHSLLLTNVYDPMFRSTDHGDSWNMAFNPDSGMFYSTYCPVVAPNGAIYVHADSTPGGLGGDRIHSGIYRSIDDGRHFSLFAKRPNDGFEVRGIAADPENYLYAVDDMGFYRIGGDLDAVASERVPDAIGDLVVSPNPAAASDECMVRLRGGTLGGKYRITVQDILGRVIASRFVTVDTGTDQCPLGALAGTAGTYFITFESLADPYRFYRAKFVREN